MTDWTFEGTWPYEPKWFDSPDGRMHYVDDGPRDGRPVVMVHGNPTWGYLVSQLHRPACRGRAPGDRPRPSRVRTLGEGARSGAVPRAAPRPAARRLARIARPARRDRRPSGLGRPDRPVLGDPPPRARRRPVHPQ